jgi:hypothetical protein
VFGDGPVHPIKRLFDNLFVKVSNGCRWQRLFSGDEKEGARNPTKLFLPKKRDTKSPYVDGKKRSRPRP